MAVFTAAALAIGAAIASTTAVTVAAAVVTTSIAIGVAGLAVTAVGVITKNQDLLKAGKIMGYVGLAGGLAGGAIGGFGAMASGAEGGFMAGAADAYAGASQFLKEGWDTGVGSLFSGGEQVAGAAPGATGATSAPTSGDVLASGSTPVPNPGYNGASIPTQAPETLSSSVPASTGAGAPGASAPTTPTVGSSAVGNLSVPGQPIIPYTPSAVLTTPTPPTGLAAMPEWAKYAGLTTAGQGVSGLASGYFAGTSAEANMEQQKLVNQQQQNQLQLLNKQGSYAPLIRFNQPAGT